MAASLIIATINDQVPCQHLRACDAATLGTVLAAAAMDRTYPQMTVSRTAVNILKRLACHEIYRCEMRKQGGLRVLAERLSLPLTPRSDSRPPDHRGSSKEPTRSY